MTKRPRRIHQMPRDQLELFCIIGLWASLIEGVILAVLAAAIAMGAVG